MPSPPDIDAVKEQLRDGDEEYHYRDDICDIDGHRAGDDKLHIGHFVVARSARGNGIATVLLDALIEVMHEDDLHFLTIKMGATECKDRDDLTENRSEHGDDWQDPTYQFLKKRGFRHLEYVDDWQWGLCVKAAKHV